MNKSAEDYIKTIYLLKKKIGCVRSIDIVGEICERHSTLSDFLKAVANVDDKTAKEDARQIGHYLSPLTYAGIKRYIIALKTKEEV